MNRKNNTLIITLVFILTSSLSGGWWLSQTTMLKIEPQTVLLINYILAGLAIASLFVLLYVLWKTNGASSHDNTPTNNIYGRNIPFWNSMFNGNETGTHAQQNIASLNISIDALTHLIEEPDSVEPFFMLLNDIEQLTNAASSAIFITPDTSSQFVLLACTDPGDIIWSNTLPHKILTRTIGNEENNKIIEFHDEKQSPGFKYIFVFLNNVDQDFSFLVLKIPVTSKLTDTTRLNLKRHSERLSCIVSSVRSARLKLRNVQYEERATIARELHDSLAQSLSYLKIQSSRLQSMLTDSDMQNLKNAMEIDAMMQDVRTTLNVAYRHLRELITTFRLTMGGKDFSQALNDSVEEFSKRSGIAFDVDNRLPDNVLTVMEETQLLHIIRESLSNVVRHSHATSALVSIHYSKQGQVTASIEDDGIGLHDIPNPEHHFGIIIMQERAHSINGDIKFVERPGGGARLTVLFSAGKQINVTSNFI